MRELFFNANCDYRGAGDFSSLSEFERLFEATSLDELALAVRKAVRSMGFKYFLYGAWLGAPRQESMQFIFSGYPEAWIETYQARNYLQIDPVVEHCLSQVTPLVWREGLFDTADRQAFWEDACRAGLASGVSVPLRGAHGESGLFSVANSCRNTADILHGAQVVGLVYLLSVFLHKALRRLVFQPQGYACGERPNLTARELECLARWADGLNAGEIASLFNLTERTVRFHLANAKIKLGGCDKGRAINRAMQWGLVRP